MLSLIFRKYRNNFSASNWAETKWVLSDLCSDGEGQMSRFLFVLCMKTSGFICKKFQNIKTKISVWESFQESGKKNFIPVGSGKLFLSLLAAVRILPRNPGDKTESKTHQVFPGEETTAGTVAVWGLQDLAGRGRRGRRGIPLFPFWEQKPQESWEFHPENKIIQKYFCFSTSPLCGPWICN